MKRLFLLLAVSAIMCSCTTSTSSKGDSTVGEPERTVTVVFRGETMVYENIKYCYTGSYLHIELEDGTDMYYSPACEWEVEDNR